MTAKHDDLDRLFAGLREHEPVFSDSAFTQRVMAKTTRQPQSKLAQRARLMNLLLPALSLLLVALVFPWNQLDGLALLLPARLVITPAAVLLLLTASFGFAIGLYKYVEANLD